MGRGEGPDQTMTHKQEFKGLLKTLPTNFANKSHLIKNITHHKSYFIQCLHTHTTPTFTCIQRHDCIKGADT